ncbi:MAG: multicopper oxidase family protein [Brevirhabdus sp.]
MRRRAFLGGCSALLTAPAFIKGAIAAQPGADLTVPPIMDIDGDAGHILNAGLGQHGFVDGASTPVLGFDQGYLGPILRMKRGNIARPVVTNKTSIPVTAHWHGLHIEGINDGGPHTEVAPGSSWHPELAIDQPAATLWYHSHTHMRTASQVYAGLAGMLLIDDPEAPDPGLPATWGVDDLPLIVQDKAFQDNGRLLYSNRGPNRMHGFRAGQIVVNGVIRPLASVPRGMVRLRILNASNARIYHFGFEDGRGFHQVASDGGLMPAPLAMTRLTLAPAERAEIVVDFSDGANARLLSGPDTNDPMGGRMMGGGMMGRMMVGGTPEAVNDAGDFEVMRFTTDDRAAPVTTLPGMLAGAPMPEFGEPVRRRKFTLNMEAGMMGRGMQISGKTMDMDRIDARMDKGVAEIWEVEADVMAHPFHVHGCSFKVLSLNGQAADPAVTGLKDVVLVDGTAELLVQVNRTADDSAPFMFHCHILEHEDAGMMGQFTVA